jgi:ABC-type multidrug transport system ATPase subunit
MRVLEVSGLYKSFGEIKAVDGLSFTVNQGDIYGLLGVNGSGKSTTIRLILSLISPDAGTIRINGEKLNGNNLGLRRNLGALIERPDFYQYLTAYKNLEILMRYSGFHPSGKVITDTLKLVGLEKFKDKKVRIFSQGMKQRLGIAQSIIHNPELIILDEPANGLDPHGMVDIRNLIVRLNKEFGKTIILSSHLLKEIEMVANRMLIMDAGKAIAEGSVTDLLESSQSRIRFKVSHTNDAIRVLKKAGIVSIAIRNDQEIICQLQESQIPGINRLLMQHNIEVYAIVPERSLENYFISLI